jgi:hypothetical protein
MSSFYERLKFDFPIRSTSVFSSTPVQGISKLVGFGIRSSSEAKYVWPVIAVRHELLENIFLQTSASKTKLLDAQTLSVTIGYLEPEKRFREWQFRDSKGDIDALDSMANSIKQYGPVFWKEYSSESQIFTAIEQQQFIPSPTRHYLLPIALAMAGRKKEALESFALSPDLAATAHFMSFKANVIRHFDL